MSLILYYGDPFTLAHKGNIPTTNIHVIFDLFNLFKA